MYWKSSDEVIWCFFSFLIVTLFDQSIAHKQKSFLLPLIMFWNMIHIFSLSQIARNIHWVPKIIKIQFFIKFQKATIIFGLLLIVCFLLLWPFRIMLWKIRVIDVLQIGVFCAWSIQFIRWIGMNSLEIYFGDEFIWFENLILFFKLNILNLHKNC